MLFAFVLPSLPSLPGFIWMSKQNGKWWNAFVDWRVRLGGTQITIYDSFSWQLFWAPQLAYLCPSDGLFFSHFFFFFHLHPHSFHPIIIRRINFFAHPHCNCHAFAIQFCVLLILFTVAGLAIFDSTNSLQCRLTTSGTHENPSKYAIRFNVCINLLRRSVGCNFCRATCDLMTRQIYIARNVVHCAVQCQQYNTHLLKYAAFEIVAIANLCKQSISPTNEGWTVNWHSLFFCLILFCSNKKSTCANIWMS